MAHDAKVGGPDWEAVFSYLEAGITVIGIDEVGRGAWAGPVTAAAVILPPRIDIPGLDDSKLLTPAKRDLLGRTVRRHAVAVGIGWVTASEVDHHGLSWAVTHSGLRAINSMTFPRGPYMVILDGRHNYLAGMHPSRTIVAADKMVAPVSAASIVAKVARDRYMISLGHRWAEYKFSSHKGYGTLAHRNAIAGHGISPVHRTTVKPLAKFQPTISRDEKFSN